MPGSRSENCFNRVVFLSFVRTKDAAARAARVRIWQVKKIKYKRNAIDLSSINQKGKIQTYLWVGLVLHALNKHTFDDFHIVLLLVAKDSWEVPKKGQQRLAACCLNTSNPPSQAQKKNRKTMILSECQAGGQQGLTRIYAEQLHAGQHWESSLTQREI